MPASPELIEQAMGFHERGQLAQAENLYVRILSAEPGHFEAQHLLGLIRYQQGRNDEALALIGAALKVQPSSPHILLNYGAVLQQMKRYEEALASYDLALKGWPDFPDVLSNRGVVLRELNRFEEALASYDRALQADPNHAETLNNRAIVLRELGRFDEALACCDQALRARPNYGAALNNRGSVLLGLKRIDEALESYDQALTIQPNDAGTHSNRGNALLELKRFIDAVENFDKALALRPDDVNALANRGLALKELLRFDEAEASLSAALKIRPDHAGALFNLGGVFEELNRREDAIRCYEQALAAKPDMVMARLALCLAELPILYAQEAETSVRRAGYEKRLRQLRDDVERGAVPGDLVAAIGSRQPFYLAYQGKNDRELQSIYGSMVCRVVAKRYPPAAPVVSVRPGERLKVGFVTGYFNSHTVWKLATRGWVSQFDRRRFKVMGYYTGVTRDSDSEAAAEICDRFVQGPMSIDDWRRTILADAPHALIYPEVGMDPTSVQLAAQRLAPVQCNFWGHPETSGFPTLDYFLTSALMESPDGDDHYTEKLVRLPNLSIYYEAPAIPPLAMTREELGLRPTSTAYWSGQSLFKYLPQFDHVFPRIAREVGDCQFVFIQHQGARHVTDLFRRRLDAAFSAYGLRAADYCAILPRLDMRQFIAAIGQCDAVLDSIGWSGGNTTLESLCHDPPIVTLPGDMMRGRHTAGILAMMGVTETIAATVDDYVAIAARLAHNVKWRGAIKERMAVSKERVYRDTVPIRALEDFLEGAIKQVRP